MPTTITLGAVIKGITERKVTYSDGAQMQTVLFHDVFMEIAGMPPQLLPPPTFTMPVTDSGQWNALFVGQAVDVSITAPDPA